MMKKETVIAIILGVFLGTIIALVLVISTKKNESNNKKVITPETSPNIAQPKLDENEFSILDPKNDFTTSKNTISVKGTALKDSLLVIQTQNAEKVLKLDESEFETSINLALGENTIRITSYHENNMNDKILKVYRIETE